MLCKEGEVGNEGSRTTGDTKAGTFIAADRYGNKYYENLKEELPCAFPNRYWFWQGQLTPIYSENTMGGL